MTYFEQNKTYKQNGSIHSVLLVTVAVFVDKAPNVTDSIAWRTDVWGRYPGFISPVANLTDRQKKKIEKHNSYCRSKCGGSSTKTHVLWLTDRD